MNISDALMSFEIAKKYPKIERMTRTYTENAAKNCICSIGKKITGRDYVIDESNESTVLNMVAWLMNNDFIAVDPRTKEPTMGRLDKGIYLYGGIGTGKTLLMSILKAQAIRDRLAYRCGIFTNSLVWTTVKAEDIAQEFLETGNIGRWVDEKCLFIDDLGAEQEEMMYMGNRTNALRSIIDARGDRSGQFTIISSNIPLGTSSDGHNYISERYGARAESRIMEMCNYMYLGGEDRRKV